MYLLHMHTDHGELIASILHQLIGGFIMILVLKLAKIYFNDQGKSA